MIAERAGQRTEQLESDRHGDAGAACFGCAPAEEVGEEFAFQLKQRIRNYGWPWHESAIGEESGARAHGRRLFHVFAVPILAGRGFIDADTRDGSTAVIVNRAFAERIAGGGNVLGRRVRHVDSNGDATPTDVEEDPWFEIVGVVPDFPTPAGFDPPDPRLYHPATPGQARLAVRLSDGSTPGFAGRLRDMAAAVYPALKLEGLESVAAARRSAQQFARVWGLAITIAPLSVLLLSAAGI